jgi:phenylalanine-4-hydroxylase
MELQSRKVLAIAMDMRSADQIRYTPAPDIVHESAGHPPFIVDVDYAEFLQRFGEIGMKAIHPAHDLDVYDAVRAVSELMQCQDIATEEIEAAEAELQRLNNLDEPLSEAALLARLHWWTVE